jgi:hypothetical protein
VVWAKKSSIVLADISHAGIVRVNRDKVNINIHETTMRKRDLRYNEHATKI